MLGAPLAMLADALSFLGSVVFLRRIRSPEPPIEHRGGPIRDRLLAGLSFVARRPDHAPDRCSSVATVNLFTFAFGALFILYVTTTLGVSPGALGLALGTGAVGGVIGALVASRIGRRIGLGPAYALGCLVFPRLAPAHPARRPGHADAGHPRPDLRLRVRGRARGDDPRHQRRRDHLRPDPGPDPGPRDGAFRFVNYGVRPIGALLGGLLGTAIGVPTRRIWFVVGSIAGACDRR